MSILYTATENDASVQDDRAYIPERDFSAKPRGFPHASDTIHLLTWGIARCTCVHGIYRKHIRIRIFRGMPAQFFHPSIFLDAFCSGSITSRPLSNQTGRGEYPYSYNVSSEPSSLLGPLSCLRAHGRWSDTRTPFGDLTTPILAGLLIMIETSTVCK